MSAEIHGERIKKAGESVEKAGKIARMDRFRQRYHFMAPAYWLNDPNGLIQFNEEYHLFYQHNPYAPRWGTMYWGHAVSRDLVHWKHLPIALAPSELYDDCENGGCFSGSAVNNSGALTLFYTGCAQTGVGLLQSQCMASSADGVHFNKYPGNPVVPFPPKEGSPDFRDPKVWKHDGVWYMVAGTCRDGSGKALLFRSENLAVWDYVGVMAESLGQFGNMWECPDYFALDGGEVLMFCPMGLEGRKTVYFTGSLDYRTGVFHRRRDGDMDCGLNFYAPQTFRDDRGRRIVIGWACSHAPSGSIVPTEEHAWNGFMSLPRTVELDGDGRLRFRPVEEIGSLRQEPFRLSGIGVDAENRVPIHAGDGISYEILAEFDLKNSSARSFGLALRASEAHRTLAEVDLDNAQLVVDTSNAGIYAGGISRHSLEIEGKTSVTLHIFVDSCSIEIFADDGKTVMSCNIYPGEKDTGIYVYAKGGTARLRELSAWGLASVWNDDVK